MWGSPLALSVVLRERSDIGSGYNPLDSFFPFDPYLLQESSRFIAPIYVTWSAVVEEEESEEELSSDSLSDSLLSSLSMSIDSHASGGSSAIGKMESQRQRTLSLSLLYEEGNGENQDTHLCESNPLSYTDADSDDDFQKLSFTRTRKMSDAGGW